MNQPDAEIVGQTAFAQDFRRFHGKSIIQDGLAFGWLHLKVRKLEVAAWSMAKCWTHLFYYLLVYVTFLLSTILAEGALALSVTLSGDVLFAN